MLHLTIHFWMKSGAKFNLGTLPFLKRFPKMRSELGTFIRNDGQSDTMQAHNLIKVQPCIIFCRIIRLNKDKVSGFFKPIHNNPY